MPLTTEWEDKETSIIAKEIVECSVSVRFGVLTLITTKNFKSILMTYIPRLAENYMCYHK